MPHLRPHADNEWPQFARPLVTNHSVASAPRHTGVTLGLCALSVGVALVLLTIARPNDAQTASSRNAATRRNADVVNTTVQSDEVKGSGTERRALSFYKGTVRPNLFTAPQPPAPPKPKAAPKAKPTPIVKPPVVVPVPVMPVNPFADWSYTGTIRMGANGDQMVALIENTKTKEGQYVKVGDNFLGAQVSAITDQMITMSSAGKPTMLAKSDNASTTPLNANAGFLGGGAPPGPQGPPPPGGPPPGMPQMLTNDAGGMVILPNGVTMSKGRADRRAQRLDANFNNPPARSSK